MYWEKPGEDNTVQTLELAVKRARDTGIKHIIAATCTGDTVFQLLELNPPCPVIAVTHHIGFASPGEDEMEPGTRARLHELGVPVLTTTHLFAGVDRSLRNQFGGVYPAEIIAQSLRIMGQGVKVAAEIAVMALDAGLIPHGEEVVSIGGTISGADAAIVVLPAHSNHFFQTEIREIICMPRHKKIPVL